MKLKLSLNGPGKSRCLYHNQLKEAIRVRKDDRVGSERVCLRVHGSNAGSLPGNCADASRRFENENRDESRNQGRRVPLIARPKVKITSLNYGSRECARYFEEPATLNTPHFFFLFYSGSRVRANRRVFNSGR